MPDTAFTLDYRRLFEILPGSYIVVQPDLTIAAVSDDYLQVTHVERKNLVGHNLFEVFPENPDDSDSHGTLNIRGSIEKVFHTGEADVLPIQKYDIQRPASLGGGYEERYWRISTKPGFDAAGKISYALHYVEDITERINLQKKEGAQEKINANLKAETERIKEKRDQIESALENTRMRLEAALDAGQLGSYELTPTTGKMICSERCLKNFGLPPTADFPFSKFLSMIHQDDRERVEKAVEDAVENRTDYEIEYKINRADGEPAWIFARGRCLYDDQGNALVMNGVTLDITSRRQIEEDLRTSRERLQLVLDSSQLGLWYCDLPFDVLSWSNLTKEHFWLPSDATVTFDDFYRIIHPEDREKTKKAIDESIIDQTQYDVEYRTVSPQGDRVKWIRAIGRGFYDENDQPYRFDGITIDISEEKMIESEREYLLSSEKNARAEAEQANRLKDDFLATLSHELRTPLSSILGWSRLLNEGKINDEAARQRALETIERNAKSQSQLIEDILDVSRIISGKLRLEVQPIELASIIETAIDAVRPAADAKNIRLQRVIDAQAMISGDADRIQQIVWNLLSNAIKFTPKEGRVQIKLERVNSSVEIIIADNGIGIEPETLPFVFERFRQSDSSTTRKHGGLGLGLAIVRHLVELHGGTVHATSAGLNQGAIFTITLPIIVLRSKELNFEDEETFERVHPTIDRNTPFNCPPEIKNLRILIVDDEPDMREMLTFIFKSCESFVTTAASTADALKIIETENFDILISDLGMPERDGYDLIKNIRKLAPEKNGRIPAIALTAYARTEDRMRVLSAGFQMHVSKPVEPIELLTVVASLANRSKNNSFD